MTSAHVRCYTKHGDIYEGTLLGQDVLHNTSLTNAVVTTVADQVAAGGAPSGAHDDSTNVMPAVFLNGNNVMFVALTESS